MHDEEPTQHEGGISGPPTAALSPLTGRQVSHYRVAEFLGGGGMGVVYRAEDSRLGRMVALKFLAPELGRDPIAKARFLNEARAASALEHPNVCTVLDMGETEEGLLFLAMPLYTGESLESRLARGPLPVNEALDIATQVARGLAKAHQSGIVHRDVKPANLFLTEDGVVKVLDFGIAKLIGESVLTRAGSLLGTPFYMAPEQTRGQEVDARADVWSLGAVLYQMLTGRCPFAGGSDAAVVYAVLHRDPEPLAHLRPEVPPEIARIVARMLEKEPERRYADAGEALAELRRAQGLASATISRVPADRNPRRRVGLVVILGLALAAATLVGILAGRRLGQAPGPQPKDFKQLTDYPGTETFPSLSPEGTYFVYARSVAGNSDIFLQRVSGSNPQNLTPDSPADDTQPAYSPDGQQIAFRSERDGGGIFLMGATGESVHRLTDFGFNPAWSPDGRQIAVGTESALDPASRESNSQISIIDLTAQARRPLPVGDGLQPSWSPHGWRIAYWGLKGAEAHRAIFTIAADGSQAPRTVIEDDKYNWSPAWSPEGKFLYFASNRSGSMNLWRIAIDERTGKTQGDPEPLATAAEWSALPSFSHDGRNLVYATAFSRSFLELLAFDPERGQPVGGATVVYQGSPQVGACDVSPDGRWFVYRAGSPHEDLFLIRTDGRERLQLTDDPARDRSPRWSPDAKNILFYSSRSGKYEAWTIRPDGSAPTQVTHLPHDVYSPVWSPDGNQIAFTYDPQGVAILDLTQPRSALRFLPSVEGGKVFARVSWSRDGKFLAGQLLLPDGSPVPGVVLWSLENNTYRRLTSTGIDPVFFPDGKRILFTEPDAIRLVEVISGKLQTLSTPPPIFSYVGASVGLDGRTLCLVRTSHEGDIWKMSLVEAGH
jgi:eukaryotic-like serine/threonine-protein kinase